MLFKLSEIQVLFHTLIWSLFCWDLYLIQGTRLRAFSVNFNGVGLSDDKNNNQRDFLMGAHHSTYPDAWVNRSRHFSYGEATREIP